MVALEKPELPKPIFIIGSGGQARETVQLIMEINRALPEWAIKGYIDERSQLHGDIIYGYPVIGSIDSLREHLTSEGRIVCAIGHPKSRFNAIQQVVGEVLRLVMVRSLNPMHQYCQAAIYRGYGNRGRGLYRRWNGGHSTEI